MTGTSLLPHGADSAALGSPLEWIPLLAIAMAAVLYGAGVRRLSRRNVRWQAPRILAAAGGLLCLAAAMLPPIADHDEQFPVHVGQHLLLAMLGPFLIALSAPVTLALRTLTGSGRRRLLRLLHSRLLRVATLPPLLLALNTGGLFVLYLTGLYGATLDNPLLHIAVHLHMLLAGTLLAFVLVGPDPMPHRPTIAGRLVLLFMTAAGHDLLGKILYARRLPVGADAESIDVGAQLLYYAGTAIDIAVAAALMADWYARSGRELRRQKRRAGASPSQ